MPVIECTLAESSAVDTALWAEHTSELALEDRSQKLASAGLLSEARRLFACAAITRKRYLLSQIVAARILPSGELAKLPADFVMLRDPDGNRLLLAWGDAFDTSSGVSQLRPYTPLPRYLDPAELDLCNAYTQQRSRSKHTDAPDRFAGLDLA